MLLLLSKYAMNPITQLLNLGMVLLYYAFTVENNKIAMQTGYVLKLLSGRLARRHSKDVTLPIIL